MGSMGGVIDIRFGNSSALSPHKSSNLEKTQAELRQTFIAAERFRRELEFLQKGGDPLDLTTGETTSVSVQTSLTDHDPDEAKGSFGVTRDSNADNLMLFNGFNNDHEVERRSLHPPANNCYSKLYSGQIIREVGIEFPKKSYKRRFRSQNARLSSSDASQSPKSINCNATTEQNLTSDEALPSKEVNNPVIKKDNNSLDSCHSIHKEKDLEGSGFTWQFACAQSNIDLVNKEHEDFILKEAKIIEAKLKRIDELSGTTLALDTHRNSHWGFVLEEMSWLANDFAQERLWKLTLASQVSRRVSLASKVRYQQKVAQTLSRAVMEFWHAIQVKHKEVKHGLQGYAIRFLEYNCKKFQCSEARVPTVPDMISDEGIIDISHEENLFYMVPHGATEAYRKSIESHLEAKATKRRRNKNNFKFDNGKSYETEAEEEDIEKNNGRQSQHVRIVSRQRVVGPFNGDTNSFQDEMEAESAGDYEKGSDRPRKKKRPNYRMRNMSDPKKFIELLDKKSKSFKMSGSGTLWSLFEDQSLVVLVHDMGPNWGLISDAINSSFLFKCIFRGSKECKNRHKMLIVGDSDEDSGSFQPYPSTLPGIPEGRARHLFEHLQGPEEEDTLKSHFEKIIIIGQKQYYQRTQNDNQETEELQQTHISHTLSLSKVSPHNLNGGPVLTPLDLCDEIESTPDVPMIPGSISSSSNLGHGNDLYKDRGRVTPMDDQHYKKMLSCTNLQDSNFAREPGTARGVQMLPNGMNRNLNFHAHGPVNHGIWVFKERQRMLQRQQFAQNGQKHPAHGVVQTGGKLVNLSQRIVKSSEPPTTKVQGEQVSQPQTVNQSMVHRQSGHDVGC